MKKRTARSNCTAMLSSWQCQFLTSSEARYAVETVFFKPQSVCDFYKTFSSRSKDYEFLIAYVLCKFLSKEWKTECVIGFPLKNRYANKFPQKGSMSLMTVADVLKRQIEENTPIDTIIAPIALNDIKRRVNSGRAFQLKRFRGSSKADNTKELTDFLNSMSQKYAKVKRTTLFIIPESAQIDFKEVQSNVVINEYPFEAIMFLAVMEEKLFIGEIWPNPGMNSYDPMSLLQGN